MSKIITNIKFIERAILIHGDRYDYSLVDYKSYAIKVKIKCKHHGIFEQSPNNHLNGQGCPVCKKYKISTALVSNKDEYVKKAERVHGLLYDYSLVEYNNSFSKIKIIIIK